MKNKLGIMSLIVSVTPWLMILLFLLNASWYTDTVEQVAGGFLNAAILVGIFFLLVVVGCILAIRALSLGEFKLYPILSIIILSPILLFFLFYFSSLRFK